MGLGVALSYIQVIMSESSGFFARLNVIAKKKRQTPTEYALGISALLTGVFFFTGANAVLTTLVVVRANELGFSAGVIGLLTSSYFAGFIGGCFFGGDVVARVGHIRAFAGLAGIATISALLYPILPFAIIWLGLRVLSGFSHAILQMTIESWLTTSSTPKTRSGFISVYRIVDLLSVTLAQFALVMKDAGPFLLFSLIAISICLSLSPVVFSKTTGPTQIAKSKPKVRRLMEIAPMSGAAALGAGFVSAGFWGLSPVYLTNNGFPVNVVALFISAVIVGGAIFQWPVGKLSDRLDRRLVIMGAAGGTLLICLLLPFSAGSVTATLLLGALFGGALMPIYALSISHASDAADPEEFVSIAGAVLLCFGVGAVLGPTFFSFVMQLFGNASLFVAMAAILALLIGFGFWRRTEREARDDADKDDFVIVTRSATPEVFELDPRSTEISGDTPPTDKNYANSPA